MLKANSQPKLYAFIDPWLLIDLYRIVFGNIQFLSNDGFSVTSVALSS